MYLARARRVERGSSRVLFFLELTLKGLNMANDNQNYKEQDIKWSPFLLSQY